MDNTIETNVEAESPLSKVQQARLQRQEAAIREGKKALASALSKSLVLLHFKGRCKCGLALTEQDKNPNAETYRCPRCGKSAPPSLAA